MNSVRSRAPAMLAEDRRAALVEATIPLLLEHGAGVTTRQIAEAADVAEGTIFRVFPDKDALMRSVVESVFDPAPVESALREIDLALAFEDRLARAVEILQDRVSRIWQVMTALGLTKPPDDRHSAANRRDAPEMKALAALFEPEMDCLRRDPMASAQLLRGLTFACSHPALIVDDPSSPEEIVSLLLDGIRLSSSRTTGARPPKAPSPTDAPSPTESTC